MEFVIESEGLIRRFGGFTAVEDLTLRVRRGDIYGFLGLNETGKTMAIRQLLVYLLCSGDAHRRCGYDRNSALVALCRSERVGEGRSPCGH